MSINNYHLGNLLLLKETYPKKLQASEISFSTFINHPLILSIILPTLSMTFLIKN